ncbi:replication fork protection component Swi3-domain-containing protein [Pyronema omphalodes]|nr:replication fork protection component Swi3-domain-containing protein [Pyronema omphalodes]
MSDDDLFNYDISDREIDFAIPEPEPLPRAPSPAANNKSKGKSKKDDLGLEEDVTVKKRRVTVKLDEERLLSAKGLPRLRKEAGKVLKFKGKGHEYKDATRLLNYYQLWADDLFKKAKFRDTLAIIEKLGHTRKIKTQREEWIGERRNEARRNAGVRAEDPEELQERIERRAAKKAANDGNNDLHTTPGTNDKGKGKETDARDPNALFLGAEENSDDDMPDGDDDDDDFDIEALRALEAAGTINTTGSTSNITASTSSNAAAISSTSKPAATRGEEDYFGDDDDDLMDFAAANINPLATARKVDEDNDEMEILRAMEEQEKEKQRTQKNVADDDDEDALAAMMEIEN